MIFTTAVGTLLLIEGIWGLFSNVVFGVLTTNRTHAVIHIALGIAGIIAARTARVRAYCTFLGVLLAAVGVLRFVPGAGDLLVSLLNVNTAVAIVNIVIGVAALVVARTHAAQARDAAL